MKPRPEFLLLAAFFACLPNATAQTTLEDLKKLRGSSIEIIKAAKVEGLDKAAAVMLNPDYPVIPGDWYELHYLDNLKEVILPFFVEKDHTANLSFFGKLEAKGMSYGILKLTVQKLVLSAYPDSLPRVVIKSVGSFPVAVRGEVKAPGHYLAWGFSRLSDAITDYLSRYSSLRDIEIVSENGTSNTYDLYPAALAAEPNGNPYLHPGDVIVIRPLQREVFIQGEVHRPGAFQLTAGENLDAALERYAAGPTNLADLKNAYISRFLSDSASTQTLYVDLSRPEAEDIVLRDMDVVVIPGVLEQLPLVFFEGALFFKTDAPNPVAAKLPWPITRDQRISTALSALPAGAITPVSDLEKAMIFRDSTGERIPVDLHRIYYSHDLSADQTLLEGDRIVIPPKLFSVIVGGAVQIPGMVPYVAGRSYEEYIRLAGGFDPELTTGRKIRIFDREGARHGSDRVIQPEDTIYVPKNNPSYIFTQRVGPIIVTLSAIAALIVRLQGLLDPLFPN